MSKEKFDYDTLRDHEARLRKVVLHSADAIPAQVTEYLRGLTRRGDWKAREQVLKTFAPLVDHLAAEYVTFALQELIATPEEADDYDPLGDLGIGGGLIYSPPAHIQGPFLRLLRRNEDEGLRLVHGLTNAATRTWLCRERMGRNLGVARTPIPITVRLLDNTHEFWGDNAIYCWYRYTTYAPSAVISALMALEVWMEEQLENGCAGEELIWKILSGTESVAVIGVCVGVSLAFPDKCLIAALPLLANPRIWGMDIHRFNLDQRGSPIFPSRHKQVEFMNERLRERNGRPQRQQNVRDLIRLALFSQDASVEARFREALKGFGQDLPFEYEEERNSRYRVQALRELINSYCEYLQAENYYPQQTGGGSILVFRSSLHPSTTHIEQFDLSMQFTEWIELDRWATQARQSELPPDVEDLSRIVRTARSIHKVGDFAEPPQLHPSPDLTRQQVIAAVAAAVVCKAWGWAQEQGQADWCGQVLLAAASCPREQGALWDRKSDFHLDHKLSAARGLTTLVAQGWAAFEVREAILRLVLDSQLQVVRALFSGLGAVWEMDDCLCRNCLSLALTYSVMARDRWANGQAHLTENGVAWLQAEWERHAAQLEMGEIPPFPNLVINDEIFQWDLVAVVLHSLPLEELVRLPGPRAELLGLHDTLLGWTIKQQKGDETRRRALNAPDGWTESFMKWAAALAMHITTEEIDHHIISAVRSAGAGLPLIAAELLNGCMWSLIGSLEPLTPEAEQIWEKVCELVFNASGLGSYANRQYLPVDWDDAVTKIVFVTSGRYFYKPEWSHAPRFVQVINRWVNIIGTNHMAYSAFLTMLTGTGTRFPVGTVLGWLAQTITRSTDPTALWQTQHNGRRTAEVLHLVWNRSRTQLRADTVAFGQFADLIDRLAAHGINLANSIQQQLEDSARE